jgi:hypothetical protein
MREQLVRDDFAARAQFADGASEIDGVPEHDGGDGEIEAGGTVAHLSITDAYAAAGGHTPNKANAARLTRNDKVQARIEELMGKAAAKAGVTHRS